MRSDGSWLCAALLESAHAAADTRNTYFAAQCLMVAVRYILSEDGARIPLV